METYAVVPDIHRDFSFYSTLDRALESESADKVFLLGDLENEFDFSFLAQMLIGVEGIPDDFKRGLQQFFQMSQQLQSVVQQAGGKQQFYMMLQQGRLPEQIMQALQRHNSMFQNLVQALPDDFLEEDLYMRHKDHKERIDGIIRKHKVKFFGVEGNHDANIIKDHIDNVDWFCHSDSLRNDGIIGHNSSSPPGTLDDRLMVQSLFALKEKYAMPQNDPMFDPATGRIPEESDWLKKYGDDRANIIVTHQEPRTQFSPKYEAPFGLTAFTQQNRYLTVFAGHRHEGKIFRDQSNGALVIRPGPNYIAFVDYDDDEPMCIRLYKKDKERELGEYDLMKNDYMRQLQEQAIRSRSQGSQRPPVQDE